MLERQLKEAIAMARSAQSQLDKESAETRPRDKSANTNCWAAKSDGGANGSAKTEQQKKNKRRNNNKGRGAGAKRQVVANR